MPGPLLEKNQQSNGINGGYTPPNYLQYRTPTGPGQGGPTRPVITPPALTGTGLGSAPHQAGANSAMVQAQQIPEGAPQPYLSGPRPQQPQPGAGNSLGKLIAGL